MSIVRCIKCGSCGSSQYMTPDNLCELCSNMLYDLIEGPDIKLRTAGNVPENELIFKIGYKSSCGNVKDGIGCRLAKNRFGFVIDADHLQQILDEWRKKND